MKRENLWSALLCATVGAFVMFFLWVQYKKMHTARHAWYKKSMAQRVEQPREPVTRSKFLFVTREVPDVSLQDGGGSPFRLEHRVIVRTLWWGPDMPK